MVIPWQLCRSIGPDIHSQEIRIQAVDLCPNIIAMVLPIPYIHHFITYSLYFKITYLKDLGTWKGLYVDGISMALVLEHGSTASS